MVYSNTRWTRSNDSALSSFSFLDKFNITWTIEYVSVTVCVFDGYELRVEIVRLSLMLLASVARLRRGQTSGSFFTSVCDKLNFLLLLLSLLVGLSCEFSTTKCILTRNSKIHLFAHSYIWLIVST